jgi:uncharacterized protein (DUF2267 family)
LPDPIAAPVARVTPAQSLTSEEYVARVAERARISARAVVQDAPDVVSAVASMLADGELEYLRAALPADDAWLFGDGPPPVTQGPALTANA